MSKPKKIAVIGGGTGGLATAALAGLEGYEVHLFERNKQLGGRANIFKAKGFTFDTGPSWYLEPIVFEKFFAEFGKSPSDYLELKAISPQYRIFFSDHSFIDIPREAAKTKALFEKIEKGAGKQFEKYLAESKFKFDLSLKTVLYKNSDTLFDFFSWELLKSGRELHVFESMDQYVKKFFKSEKLQQIIQYTLVFLGGAPKNVPALYSLMTHVDFNLGVYYPMGGFYKVVEAMIELCKLQKVKFHTETSVSKIILKDGKATGLVAGGKKYDFDAVVSNADFYHTETMLPEDQRMYDEAYWKKSVMAPSAFLLFLGVRGKLPRLHHHNIFFGENWLKHFDDIFANPSWPQKPSLYINKPSFSDQSVAPAGHENLMVLVPIASHLQESPAWREAYADFILRYIEEEMDMNIRDKIVYQKIFSGTEFTELYNSFGGNALGGLAHTLWHTGPFRPPNKHRYVKNLFFAGANTVPGIGVPSTLISAHLVKDRLKNYFG